MPFFLSRGGSARVGYAAPSGRSPDRTHRVARRCRCGTTMCRWQPVTKPAPTWRLDDFKSTTRTPGCCAATWSSGGGQHDGAAFVAARGQLKEEILALPVDRDVANLIDDEELRLREDLQPLVEPALGQRLAATARCVLPTPAGPSRSTLSPVSRYWPSPALGSPSDRWTAGISTSNESSFETPLKISLKEAHPRSASFVSTCSIGKVREMRRPRAS